MRLKSKVAVVTGACGGIGLAIIDKFIAEGAKVIAADLNRDDLEQLESKYQGSVKGIVCNVTDYTQVESMIAEAQKQFGTLDIVINNAGLASPKTLIEHDPLQDFDAITQVNQKGVYHGILAGGKALKALNKPGVIINTSSVYGKVAAELTFTYNVSKAAVDMMTKCAALEYAPFNIRVCAVAPGRVNTTILHAYKELGLWDHITKEQMRKTLTQPEEIAAVFAFLASDESNCINGTTLNADDGFTSFKYPML